MDQKRVQNGRKMEKWPQIQIPHPKISLRGNFQVKQTILNFLAFWAKNRPKRAKLTKKGSKMTEKVKNDTKFRFPTLKLVLVEIFRSNAQIWIFQLFPAKNGPKRGVRGQNGGKKSNRPKKA